MRRPRIAIVHDALINTGGAERVVTHLHSIWPEAPIFTSFYLPDATYSAFKGADIRSIRHGNLVRNEYQAKALYPLAINHFRRLNLRGYDIVINSTAFASKGIPVPNEATHFCYCYNPIRLAWEPESYLARAGAARLPLKMFSAQLRAWDYRVAQRVKWFGTTCRSVAAKIRRSYGKEARVLYAPVEMQNSPVSSDHEDYFLIVSRLNYYKRIDLAVDAFSRLNLPLVIVGDGPERKNLEVRAGPSVRFLGRVEDSGVKELYRACRAFIFPGLEDYGLTPIEAQSHGKPVLAYGAGGVLETVLDGITGLYFPEQTVEDLIDAIRQFDDDAFDPEEIRAHSEKFGVSAFKDALVDHLSEISGYSTSAIAG